MIHVYLCDDNKIILEKYKGILTAISKKYQIMVKIITFTSGEQLLFYLEDAFHDTDIIYLDILMGGQNGLDTAKRLRSLGCSAEIIFLTSDSQYVFDSFDIAPANYILKDTVTEERFAEIFLKAAAMAEKKSTALFTCENGSMIKQIPLNHIAYFEIRNRIVTVHYNKTSFNFYAKLEDIEARLHADNFIRVHRSYLLHMSYIDQLSKDSISLITSEIIPLGITYAKNVKLKLTQYWNLFQ